MNNTLPKQKWESLLIVLHERFNKHQKRHAGMAWEDVRKRLENKPDKFWSLAEMERTGGEPDVIGYDESDGSYIFCDCSAESPAGRRNICYDQRALEDRKKNKPTDSATRMAEEMGIALLTEAEYRKLLELGSFDTKTSSWVHTPATIRQLGGALFCDRRFNHVFVYHNGASSYYSNRGFRGIIKI
ncbi:MAG: DUF4256 domain-containing protein [Sphaerochaetaceae bacterium]|nr:DUF4256 domain-containing protein [Sphaerochaetaceae bacterium]